MSPHPGPLAPLFSPLLTTFISVMSLLRKRKNIDIKEYSHEGMFIPNILLALSQTPRFDGPPSETSTTVKVEKDCSRPYQCEYCGKSSPPQSSLSNVHIQFIICYIITPAPTILLVYLSDL